MVSCQIAMADCVKSFLSSVGMQHHFHMFQTRGYDDESDIPHLNASDLKCIGVNDPVEIIIILKAAQAHKQSREHGLIRWLRDHGLEHYFEGFVQSGLILLSDIAQLDLPNEELYDELEITLPGHQRRLEHAVRALGKQQIQRNSDPGEGDIVTEGWWGFPTYLPNAKYPFLCVQASIKSTRPLSVPKAVDFMVDSGSDVSTLREEIIQGLNLEPITTVKSCGAYGSQRTTLYRAYLTIGDCKMEIEIIGSSYDSLGSQVLRHFCHRIDNNRHKWIRMSNSHATTSQDNNHCNHLSLSSQGETETVSIFPGRSENQRSIDESCSGSGENNALQSSDEGSGSGAVRSNLQPHQEVKDPPVSADETDSVVRLIHTPSGINAGLEQQNRLSHTLSHMNQNQKRSRVGSVYNSNASTSHQVQNYESSLMVSQNERTLATPYAQSFRPSPTGCVSMHEQAVQAKRTNPTKPREGGHLKLSSDGTLSLMFGPEAERACKRQKTSHDET